MRYGSIVLSCAFVFFAMQPLAVADGRTRFDLPAEPLDKALRDFALQAHCNISYNPGLVQGLQSRAIRGEYARDEVLSWLLRGTTLRAVSLNADTIQVLERSATSDIKVSVAESHLAGGPSASNGGDDISPRDVPSEEEPTGSALSEIVVTGTNITGVSNKTVPVLTFNRDDIQRSGYATTEDFLDSLPQNVKSTANSADGILAGNQGINNLENSTSVNLRGLGTSSTLTLLNGHRVAPSSYGTGVDISMIPLSAVERIEILTDGSSAVYGSDAVGGVVNIILRRAFNGEETSARLEELTRGGGTQRQVAQSIGRSWDSGGALGVLQFQDSDAIHSTQRDFTSSLPVPTDIYPSSKRYSAVFSAHQDLMKQLEMFSDVLAYHDNGFRAWNSGGDFAQIQLASNTSNSVSVNAGLRWQPVGDWRAQATGLFSQVNTLERIDYTPSENGYINGNPYARNYSAIKQADAKIDGTLVRLGDSSLKLAVGGSYRRESFSSLLVFEGTSQIANRRASAEFAELYSPLITSSNALPLLQKLDISAAVRRDTYSDFGSRASPRIGVYWSPLASLGIRAAFSTSFRAPNAFETTSITATNAAFIESGFPLPDGTVGNALFYGNQVLGPETSHNVTLGLDLQPTAVPGSRLTLNYYRIHYANRIVSAPFAADMFIMPQVYGPLIRRFSSDAAISAFLAGLTPTQMLYDFSDGSTGLAGVRYAAPYGVLNASDEFTEGADAGLHSNVTVGSRQKLVGDLNATYIRSISTTYCAGCTATDLVNTYGNPLRLRLRASLGWSNGLFSVNTAVNHAGGYTDTNVLPFGRIRAFTSMDLNANCLLPLRVPTSVGVAVANLFDTNTPHTAPGFNRLAYDPSNADPRGRALALQVRSQW